MDFHQIAEREVGSAFQDLIHKLKEAAEAELRDVRRELEHDLDTIRRQADTLREELETESARAATLEADLDAVIEAHRTVDGERLRFEQEAAALGGRLESARAELTRLQESLESETALRALLETDLAATRDALAAAEARVRTLEGNTRALEASVSALQSELQQVRAAAEAELEAARAAAEAQVRELRASADRELSEVRADSAARVQEALALADARGRELDALRASSEAQLRDAQAEADARAREIEERASGHLHAARDEAERRIREADASMEARLQAVRDEVQARADAIARELREQAQADLREARERADAEVRQARESSDQALEELRVEVEAQVDAVRADAAAEIREARAQADADLQDLRTRAAAELREAQETARAHEDRVTELTVRLAASRDELAAAREELSAVRAQGTAVEGRDETIAALEKQLAEARDTERLLRDAAAEAREISLRLRDEGQAQAARIDEAIARAEAAEAATRLAEDELATLRARPDTGAAMLQASTRALETLSAVTSVADLVAALARQLAPHFERVAIFRVKGTQLEGEQGAGLERSTDVTSISMPLTLDSPLTRAAKTRKIQDLDLLALADAPAPLGGSPSAALAVPIVYQGETFAVAYVDSSDEIEPAPRALAALLAGQASVLLGRLSQEMKLMKELRDYAALLVQEAEQMFVADLESGRPEADRRRRLAETIECARQLFAQRAALEGPAAARALDEYLMDVMTAPNDRPFAADLATILTTV